MGKSEGRKQVELDKDELSAGSHGMDKTRDLVAELTSDLCTDSVVNY